MDRFPSVICIWCLVILSILLGQNTLWSQAGPSQWFTCEHLSTTNCDGTVPSLFVDLRNSPSQKWYSCKIQRGQKDSTCCNIQIGNNDQCIEFKVLVHPNTQALILEIPEANEPEWQADQNWYDAQGNNCPSPPIVCDYPAPGSPGAKPSINTYRINCGPLQGGAQGDEPACLTSSIINDTIFLTFCQTGNNQNVYRIRTIQGDINAGNLIIQQGACGGSITVDAQDIDISTITWTSNDHPSYNAFLNTTMGDTTVIVTVPNGDPLTYATWISGVPYLSYEVCGEIIGHSVCTNLQPVCATAQIAIIQPPSVTVADVWGCPGAPPYPVEAVHPGRDNFEFYWFDGPDPTTAPLLNNPPNPLGDWDWDYTSFGTKSVVVRDVTVAALGLDPDCTLDTVQFSINPYPVPPAQINGPPMICVLTDYTFTAVNAGAGATYDWNFGSGASPATYSGTGTSGRNPPDVQYTTCGDKTITLTVTNTQGCDSTTMITVPGDAIPPDLSGCNLPEPTVECGGTAQNNANITAWHNNNLAILQSCAVDVCPIWVFSDFDLGDFTPDPSCGGGTTAGSITVQYRVTDSCQSSFISATYTIEDNTPPVVSIGEIPNLSFECVGLIPPPDTNIMIDEACGSVTRTWLGDSPSGNPCNLTIVRSYRVEDACGNVLDTNQIFTINDVTPPTITCPTAVSFEACDPSILANSPAVGNLEYSESNRLITLADLQGLGGDASDNCGIESLYYFDQRSGSCPVVITRTFVVVDSCNLSASCTQQITIDDTTFPTITCPGPETIEGCDLSVLSSSSQVGNLEFSTSIRFILLSELTTLGGSASDNCFIDSLYYIDQQTGSCPIVVTRTFVVVDSCNNRSECTQIIQVDDTTFPTITCPGPQTIEGCNEGVLANSGQVGNLPYSESIALISIGDLTGQGGAASDNCFIDSLYYYDTQSGSCPIVITRTYAVVDSCGNRTECTQTIQINDTTDPVLTCPGPQNIEACGVYDLATLPQVGNLEYSESIRFITVAELQAAGGNASDLCGIDSLYYIDIQNGSCPITITRTFVVVDSCNNRVDCPQVITIDDTTLPTITCPADDVLEACSADDLANSPQVGNLEYSEIPRIITVGDIQGLGGNAADNCGIDSLYYVDAQSGNCPILITRTFTVVDSCGNRANCIQQIQIDDTTDPVLTCPSNQVVEACLIGDLDTSSLVGNLGYSPNITLITVTQLQGAGGDVSDNCGIDSLYYFDSRTGACPIVITRTFVAIDSCGNRVQCTQEIQIDDTTDPIITCPVDQVVEACDVSFLASSPQVGNLEYSAAIRPITLADLTNLGGAASDNCGIDSLYYIDTQNESCPIIVTRTFVVVDSCGNRAECDQEIQIDDTTDPLITCPADQVIEACGVYDLVNSPQVGNLEYSSSIRFITLSDLTGQGGSASDECGIDSLYYFDTQTGSCPIIVTRTYVVVDSCGNRAECPQEIQIDDTTDPTITCPANEVLEACGVYDLANSSQVGFLEFSIVPRTILLSDLQGLGGDASDLCGIDSLYYFDVQAGSCPIIVTRTFVVTDSCGNRADCTQEIQIDDTTDPSLVCPADDVLEACGVEDLGTSPQVGNLEFSAVPRFILPSDLQGLGGDATDNCGLDSLYYYDTRAGSCPIIVTRTFVAVDSCGNQVDCSQEIVIDDTTDPLLTCPSDEIIEGCDESILSTSAQVGSLEFSTDIRPITVADLQSLGGDASDNCSIDSLYYFDTQTGFCPIVITRTFVVVDSCENRVECTQEIQIIDTTDPLISCPSDQQIEGCDVGILATSAQVGFLEYSAIVRPITLGDIQGLGGSASDECGIDSLYYFDDQTNACPIIITRTFVVVDSCGNRAECTQEIQIDDTTDPVITCPVDQILEACGVYDLANSAQVGNLEYSEVPRFITLAELQGIGGDASDECGIDSLYYVDQQAGSCPIIVTRTFVVVDSCGNRVDCDQEIQIDDTTDPVLSCPTDQVLEACGVYDLANAPEVGNLEYSPLPRIITLADLQGLGGNASDLCGLDSLYYYDIQTGFCPIIVTRTYVATDSCGNRVECPQEIQINDTTDPLLTCPADDVLEACGVEDLATSPQVGNLEYSEVPRFITTTDLQGIGGDASDNCGLDSLYYLDSRSGSCPIIVTRTFVAVDSCGNRVECQQEIQIDDTTFPAITCPGDEVVEGCDETILASSPQVGSLEYSETIREITLTDLQGLGGDASDNCNIDSLYYFDQQTGFCPLIITRTFVAVDSCGNRTECQQEIQIIDTTDPLISCPTDLQLEACGVSILASTPQVGNLEYSEIPRFISVADITGIGGSASDECGIDSLYYIDNQVQTCPIIITRTFVVVDSCGNRADCTQEIQIDDTTNPTLTCPVDQNLEGCGVYDLATASEVGNLEFSTAPRIISVLDLQGLGGDAADNCGIDSLYYFDTQSGSCPIVVTRTFVVTDSCGNRLECQQEIQIDDTTVPTISCPGDVVLEACNTSDLGSRSEVGNLEFSAGIREITLSDLQGLGGSANDECGIDSLYYRDIQTGSCPTIVTRTFVVVDSCGNRAECDQEIQIDDTTDPSLVCPADVSIEGCSVADLATAFQVGNLEFSPTIRFITIVDLQGIGGNASDLCGLDSLYYRDVQAGSCPTQVTRTFVAIDSCGNRVECDQLIEIDDTTLPSIICPADQSIDGCDENDLASAAAVGNLEYSETVRVISLADLQSIGGDASDNCYIDSLFYYDIQAGDCPLTITRTFVVVDSCGNRIDCTQEIEINNVVDPTISCPADVTIEACSTDDLVNVAEVAQFGYSETPVIITLSDLISMGGNAGDNCGIALIEYQDELIDPLCPIIIERTFTVYDSCNLQVSCTQTITIEDTQDPTISCPGGLAFACISDVPPPFGDLTSFENGGGSVSDNCAIDPLSFAWLGDVSDGNKCPETLTRTYQISDWCGNLQTCTQTIRINDSIPPQFTGVPVDETVQCDAIPDPPQIGLQIQATDNCGIPTIEFSEVIIPGECENTYDIVRTWSATDSCDNSEIVMQQITVVDCQPNVEISINPNPVCLGHDVTLTATVTNNYTNPVYRWQFFTSGFWVNVPGGDDLIHQINNVQNSNAGLYRFIVADNVLNLTNNDCNVISEEIELIITQPSVTDLVEEICEGETYTVGTSQYSESGSYTDVLIGPNGCDSIVNLDLTVNVNTFATINPIICEGDNFIIGSSVLNETGTYTETITNAKGCDSIVTINLTVIQPTTTSIEETICEGSTINVAGQDFDVAGNYTVILTDQFGCDSIISIQINTIPPVVEDLDVTICQGQSFEAAGNIHTRSGGWQYILTSQQTGCDSILNLRLTVTEDIEVTIDETICIGDSIMVGSNYYSENGTYIENLVASGGCDSIVTLNLQVVDTLKTFLTEVLCEGESFSMGGSTYNMTGIYSVLLPSSGGCDSLVTLDLTVDPQKDTSFAAVLCAGEFINVGGEILNETGSYDITIPSAAGCDSMIHVDLMVFEQYDTTYIFNICAGDTVQLGDSSYFETGVYTQTHQTVNGCDSIVIVDLTVHPVYDIQITQRLCEGGTYTVGNNTYSETGIYSVTLQSTAGCDSIITLDLAILTIIEDTISVQICEGDSYTLGSNSYSVSGTYQETFVSAAGCDSVVTLELEVLNQLSTVLDEEICEGETYDFDGDITSTSGTYTKTYTSQAGCDSVVTLNLNVVPAVTTNISQDICEGSQFPFGGNNLTLPGIYRDTLISDAGCDSIVVLQLAVIPTVFNELDVQSCTGESFTFGGENLTSSGVYMDTVTSTSGCDSIVTLNLTFHDVIRDTLDVQICEDQSYTFNGETYTSTGVYEASFISSAGCDSVVTLILAVNNRLETNMEAEICFGGSYSFFTQTLTEAGTYEHTLASQAGCDSVIILDLSVIDQITDTISAQICPGQSYTFNNQDLTSDGTYNGIFQSTMGCDSVVTLLLEVKDVLTTELMEDICQGNSYTFGSQQLDSAGTYVDTLLSTIGCDSIVTLTLQVNQHKFDTIKTQICEGQTYTFAGEVLSSSGTYEELLSTSKGCDSLVTLILEVNAQLSTTIDTAICFGESIDFFGTALNSSGTFDHTLASTAGCDSVVTYNLTVLEDIVNEFEVQLCKGQSFTFDGQEISADGTYNATYVSSQGCDSTVIANVVTKDILTTDLEVDLCQGETYNFGQLVLDSTGIYSDTLVSTLGCDSIVTVDLQFFDVIRDTISAQICEGQIYSFNGQDYTVSGSYEEILSSSAGCDSIVTLLLQVNSVLSTVIDSQLCFGSTYSFFGSELTESGTYEHTLTSTSGCDSVITLNLIVLEENRTTIDREICNGTSLTFNENDISTAGTYYDTLVSNSGCDSIIILNLSLVDAITEDLSYTLCEGDSVSVNGTFYDEAGSYLDTLMSTGGCDSILQIQVNIVTEKFTAVEHTMCENESYSFAGQNVTTSGIYYDTLMTGGGCDSIVELSLEVLPVKNVDVSASICEGQSYTVGSETFNATGEYDILLTSSDGCDSTVHLSLQVSEQIVTEETFQICDGDSVEIYGVTYSIAGTYRDTLPSTAGCDSISILHIEFTDFIEQTLDFSICEGEFVDIDGESIGVDTVISKTYTSAFGCDSIVTYNISLLPGIELEAFPAIVCEGETVELTAVGVNYQSLQWSPSQDLSCDDCLNPTASPSQTTTYVLTGIGCGDQVVTDSVTVEVVPLPGLTMPEDQTISTGEVVTLTALVENAGSTIDWYNLNTGELLCSDCPSVVVQPTSNTTYRAVASNELDCDEEGTVDVLIEGLCDVERIIAANAFTPNEDGSNDLFEIRNEGTAEVELVQIFNRWGEIVFESSNLDDKWDGTYLNEPVNPGVYMYTMTVLCIGGEQFFLTGNVTVIR